MSENDLYSEIFKHSPVSLIITDTKGVITKVNTSALKLLGYTSEELSGADLQLILPFKPAEETILFQSFTEIIEAVSHTHQFRVKKKNGATFVAELQVSYHHDSGIWIWSVQPIHREVTLINELKERVKEQISLLKVTETLFKSTDINTALSECIPHIRDGWQFPEYTVVRIKLNDGSGYTTDGFKETPWGLFSSIEGSERQYGTIEVFYTGEIDGYGDSVFFKEEKKLIDGLAKLFSIFLDHLYAINKLRENEKMIT
jgi:PAS domain S-box-containing protein